MEPGWMKRMARLFNLWEIRAAVLSSFIAHLYLLRFAVTRRHKADGRRVFILGLAYQLASWVAPYALSNLSLCDPSPRQQLIAFWAPFLLHHLGGPDNISALSLEDNALSGREALTAIFRIGGAGYVLYKHVYIDGGGGGTLVPASIIIFTVGAAKNLERVLVLWRGKLGNIRSSIIKKRASEGEKKKEQRTTSCSDLLFEMGSRRLLVDDEALMVAHHMLPFCKRAMSDSSINADDQEVQRSRKLFTLGWENVCSVVEMELSLMYDILYTKAAVIHTWHGHTMRFLTPLAMVVAIVLFGFNNIEGQAMPDVIITYALLLGTFLLDAGWLLTALGSTWMHADLQASKLLRALFGIGSWRWLRRVMVSVSLALHTAGRLFQCRTGPPPASLSSYRRWSGTVGKLSLLHECTRKSGACGTAAKAIGLKKVWNEHKLSHPVKALVFNRVQKILRSTYEEGEEYGSYSRMDITTYWGQVTTRKRHEKLKGVHLAFGHEFQEDILVWHIATKLFLVCRNESAIHEENAATHAKAIEAMSEHLMFLMVVRPYMLPGLELLSLYEATLEYLHKLKVCKGHEEAAISSTRTTREEKLARSLVNNKEKNQVGLEDSRNRLVYDGANIAVELLEADRLKTPKLLELVLNIWVDKLLYAATRCSRESHARQLGHGGDLTTIIWIMVEHAGPFQIGDYGPGDEESAQDTKAISGDGGELGDPAFGPLPSPVDTPDFPAMLHGIFTVFDDDEHMRPQGLPPLWYQPAEEGPALLPADMLPGQAFGERVDAKPRGPRRRPGRYATLYPVD
ncbi:hypothetical protein VPH35_025580 [Triticum aestivum]